MSKRTDAIGQELRVNECAYVISKSSNAGGSVGLITRLNPKTIQIDGKYTIEDDRLIVVTQNLIDKGDQIKVDNLRKWYGDKVDHTDPTANPKKLPVRFVLLKAVDGSQHLVRFEGDKGSDAAAIIDSVPELKAIVKNHQAKALGRFRDYRSDENYLAFKDYWRVGKECIFAYRSLPDNIARYVVDGEAHVIIPEHDQQPIKVVIPKK